LQEEILARTQENTALEKAVSEEAREWGLLLAEGSKSNRQGPKEEQLLN
jgi:hypothetical protein